MFRGAAALNLDAKGRLAVPSKHRDALQVQSGGRLVMTAHPHGCLLLYPQPAWLPIEEKINALPSFDRTASTWKRLMLGYAEEFELDNSGRLLVPQVLRELTGLEKEVMLVGQGNYFELWSMNGWKKQMEQAFEADAALPSALADFSL
jgi:MraZ protein